MNYATVEDLLGAAPESLLIELAGDIETAEPDEVAMERALTSASSEIDGYVGSRYSLPLPVAPKILERKCIDIAIYDLMRLRSMGDIEDVRDRYLDVLSFLKDVSKGMVSLGLEESNTSPPTIGPRFTPGSNIMKNLGY